MKKTLSYFEHNEMRHAPKGAYTPLPQDVVPFLLDEPIEVKHSRIHPREFAKLFPAFAKPRKLK